MGGLWDVLIRGITTVALAILALLSQAHAGSKKPAPVKAGQLFNGDRIRETYEAMRVVERGRRLLNTIAPEDVLTTLPTLVTKLSEDLNAEGYDHTSISTLPGYRVEGARTGPPKAKRPLQMAFYDRLDDSRTDMQKAYIMDELLPATGTILARSMRLRTPSGPLLLAGIPDEEGLPIPAPAEGVDADVLLKVTSQPRASAECEAVVASAAPLLYEFITARPIFGVIRLCKVDENSFNYDLTTIVHEILHALGFIGALFPVYPGYVGGLADIAQVTESRTLVRSPNVAATVRAHFGCPSLAGADFEEDGGPGTANAHWEERMFEGEMLDAGDSGSLLHNSRHVLTDLTLSLLQDTNWYDVKYGSAGFNSYGYKAGCVFAMGTFEEAQVVPEASRYLCVPEQQPQVACLHDFSGDGSCISFDNWDGFWRVYQAEQFHEDCQGEAPGSRCLVQFSSSPFPWRIGCVDMSCSVNREVLVGGTPCDNRRMECPDAELMCGNPGLLTCVGPELNDCSGNGDCLQGHCFCHSGWGGPDCSTPVCISTCPNGNPCPASGFCGVPECGTWSDGADDRGTPCNAGAGTNVSPVPSADGSAAPASLCGPMVTAVTAVAAAGVVVSEWLW